MPSSLTALAVFEAATDRGLRFHLGLGAPARGFVGGVALAQLSYSWGLRYRNRDGRAGIGGMPDWYLDYFMVDPILEADGCIYTDPSSIGRLKIICVGTPDPSTKPAPSSTTTVAASRSACTSGSTRPTAR
jgi:hypothetical protein